MSIVKKEITLLPKHSIVHHHTQDITLLQKHSIVHHHKRNHTFVKTNQNKKTLLSIITQEITLLQKHYCKSSQWKSHFCFTPSQSRKVISGRSKLYSYHKSNSDSLLNTHSTVEDWRNLEKMKLNEPGISGKQKYNASQWNPGPK